QRAAELPGKIARARIEMWLKCGDDPPARKGGPRRGERGADLGRVVPVVVDYGHSARVAQPLKPTLRSGHAGQSARHRRKISAEREAARHRGERIEHVVPAGQRELDAAERLVVEGDIERAAAIVRDD